MGYGVSALHGEMAEQFGDVRERLGRLELGQDCISDRLGRLAEGQAEHGGRLGGIGGIGGRLAARDARFDAIDSSLDAQGQMLTEILRRLPGRPSNGQARGEDDH